MAPILADGEASPPMRRVVSLACALGLVLACVRPYTMTAVVTTALDWRECGGAFLCADLAVPVDHDEPDGPSLSLRVVRLPATARDLRLGVLVVNPGGPGVSAVAYLRASWPRFGDSVRERFDLVAFDTRGTGGSTPLDCHDAFDSLMAQDPAPADDAAWQGAVTASRAFAEECARKHGGLLPFMGTADSARDLDQLRAALLEERISYLGYSYGTALGAVYASLFPERVRALVLDGAIDPSFELLRFTREQSIAVEDALTAYDTEARKKGWHGRESLDEVYRAAPRKSTVLYGAAEGLSSPPEGWQDLADALARAREGDWRAFESLAHRYFGERGDGTRDLSVEAQLATLCADLHRLRSAEAYRAALPEQAAASPHFGAGNLLSHLPCAFWPEPESGPLELPDSVELAPALVLANSGDPLTPHLWGERLTRRFPSATRVDVESRGHTAFGRGDPCIDGLVEKYLLAPAPPARSHCPSSAP